MELDYQGLPTQGDFPATGRIRYLCLINTTGPMKRWCECHWARPLQLASPNPWILRPAKSPSWLQKQLTLLYKEGDGGSACGEWDDLKQTHNSWDIKADFFLRLFDHITLQLFFYLTLQRLRMTCTVPYIGSAIPSWCLTALTKSKAIQRILEERTEILISVVTLL